MKSLQLFTMPEILTISPTSRRVEVFSGLTNMLTGPIVNAAVDSNNFVPLLVEADKKQQLVGRFPWEKTTQKTHGFGHLSVSACISTYLDT